MNSDSNRNSNNVILCSSDGRVADLEGRRRGPLDQARPCVHVQVLKSVHANIRILKIFGIQNVYIAYIMCIQYESLRGL